MEVSSGLLDTLKSNKSGSGIAWLIGLTFQSTTQLLSVAKCLNLSVGSLQDVAHFESADIHQDLGGHVVLDLSRICCVKSMRL